MTSTPRRRLPDVFRVAVVAVTVLVAGIGALWAVLTPGFRAPDEPQHVNTVVRLMDEGGWPAPGEQTFLPGVHVAADEAGWVDEGRELIRQNSHAHPGAWWGTGQTPFVLLVPDPPPTERTSILDVDQRVTLYQQVDQMTQHPPGYYAVAAGYLTVLGADDWAWDTQLLALRLLDVVLVAGIVPLVVVTVRRLGGSRSASLVGALAITAPAQLLYVNAAVSNDSLLNLFGAAVLALSAVVMTSRWDWRHVVGMGLLLGGGLLTKGFMLAFIPVVALAFLASTGSGRPLRSRALGGFWALAVAFAVGGWWWLKNLFVHGTFQPDGYPGREPLEDTSHLGLNLWDFAVGAENSLVTSAWGNFGWLESPMPTWFQRPATYLTLALVVAAVVLAGRRRIQLLVVLSGWIGVLGVVIYGALQEYYSTGLFAGLQGRYLFVGVLGILAAIALLLDRLTSRLSPGVTVAVRVGAGVAFLGLALWGLLFGFTAFYVEFYEDLARGLSRWNDWSSFGITKLVALVGATALAGLASLVLLGLQSWRDATGVGPGGIGAGRAAPGTGVGDGGRGTADEDGRAEAGRSQGDGADGDVAERVGADGDGAPAGRGSAAEAPTDLAGGTPDDLARAGVPLDPAGGGQEPDGPAAGESGRQA